MGKSWDHGPSILLDRDVVLVTFNYRVGPLGKLMNLMIRILLPSNLYVVLFSGYFKINKYTINASMLYLLFTPKDRHKNNQCSYCIFNQMSKIFLIKIVMDSLYVATSSTNV